MPVKSRSYLKVLLRGPKQGNPLLIWQLVGDHGEQWSVAQVALPGVKNVQVSERTKIAHARYISFPAWLRGFRVKIVNFLSFFCLSIPKRDLDTKKTTPKIEVCPESLGTMSEY